MPLSNNWCSPNKWYLDKDLITVSYNIPRDAIDSATITAPSAVYNIINDRCFSKIISLKCQYLRIVTGSDTPNDTAIYGFTCEKFAGNQLDIDERISLTHWEQDTFCEYEVDTLSIASGGQINYVSISMESGTISGPKDILNSVLDSINLTLNSVIIGDGSRPTYINCSSGNLNNINDTGPKTSYIGKFNIMGGQISGSGDGTFMFGGAGINNANITGPVMFSGGSVNNGIVNYSPVIFSGGCTNNGIILGEAIFLSDSINKGTISGNATFSGGSVNSGIVNNNAKFYSGTINYGIVSGESTLVSAINNGILTNGANLINNSINYGSIASGASYFKQSINRGNISTELVSFDDSSMNYGSIDSMNIFQVTFGSGCGNTGIISISESGNGIFFNHDSFNNSSLKTNKLVFTDISVNQANNSYTPVNDSGSIVIFSKSGINYCDASYGETTSVVFNDNAVNKDGKGSIYKVTFNQNSINEASGVLSGILYNNSINSGYIQLAIFYDSSKNYGTVNNGSFFNRSINTGIISFNGMFKDRACNSGGSGVRLCFCNNSMNSGLSTYLNCEENSINYSGATTSTAASFSGNSINFEENSSNCIFTFKGSSINNGKLNSVNKYTEFYNNSQNRKISALAKFYDDSINTFSGVCNTGNFYDRSSNMGYVNSGNFYNNSINKTSAPVIFANFYEHSQNLGTLRRPYKSGQMELTYGIRKISLNDNSINLGSLVNCDIIVKDSGINKGNLTWLDTPIDFTTSGVTIYEINPIDNSTISVAISTGDFISYFYCGGGGVGQDPPISLEFKDYSINYGSCVGYKQYKFLNQSYNYGSLSTYPVIPNSHNIAIFSGTSPSGSGCKNYGNIQGLVSFTNTENYGRAYAANFNGSSNFADISGTGVSEYIVDGCGFSLPKISQILFENKSINSGLLNMYSVFDNSINFSTIKSSGSFDNSVNLGFISNNATFLSSENCGDIGGNLDMTNSTNLCGNIRGSAFFTNSSIFGSEFLNYLLAYPFGSLDTGPSFGTPINKYLPTGLKIYRYIGENFPNGGTIAGDAMFSDSKNYGFTVNGMAQFNRNSKNFGTILGYSSFYDSTNCYGGILRAISSFENYSKNYGLLEGKALDDSAYISEQYPDVAAFLSGINFNFNIGTTFHNSINRGTINTPSLFYHSTNSSPYINKSTIFIDSVNDQTVSQNGINPYEFETVEDIPPYPLYPRRLNVYSNGTLTIRSRPSDYFVYYGAINDKAVLYNSTNKSLINGINYLTKNSTNSLGSNIIGDVYFSLVSENKGYIEGSAYFDNSTDADGTINGNCIFTNNSSFVSAYSDTTILGNATFTSGSCYFDNNGLTQSNPAFNRGSIKISGTISDDGTCEN
jgi:hypothetical protein